MISIVTGTLNRLELLKQVIENTVNSNDKLELVLVDGGSTDGTIEYVKSLNNENIKLIEFGKRSKVSEFMNIGIKNSKYEIICQWNDDVILLNDWNEVIDLIDDNEIYNFSKIGTDNIRWIKEDLVNFGLIKKDVYRKIGLLDQNFKTYHNDFDFTLRAISQNIKIKNCPNIIVKETSNVKSLNYYIEDEYVLEHNKLLYSQGLLPNVEFLK